MKIIISVFALLFIPITALANAINTNVPSGMINFTIKQCGTMPKTMIWGIIILVILTALAIIMKGGKNNE